MLTCFWSCHLDFMHVKAQICTACIPPSCPLTSSVTCCMSVVWTLLQLSQVTKELLSWGLHLLFLLAGVSSLFILPTLFPLAWSHNKACYLAYKKLSKIIMLLLFLLWFTEYRCFLSSVLLWCNLSIFFPLMKQLLWRLQRTVVKDFPKALYEVWRDAKR